MHTVVVHPRTKMSEFIHDTPKYWNVEMMENLASQDDIPCCGQNRSWQNQKPLRNRALRKYELEMSKKLYGISQTNLHKDTRNNLVYFIPDKK